MHIYQFYYKTTIHHKHHKQQNYTYTNKNLTRCNGMQFDLFYCKITLHVSGVHRTHHQVY